MFPGWLDGVDTLVHAGDATMGGRLEIEIVPFMKWLNSLPVKNIVLIAGNHDFFFEKVKVLNDPHYIHTAMMGRVKYLEDSGVTIDGIKFWGSPVQPWFHNWAFNRHAGDDIEKHWKLIPEDTDVLITHGPPIGYLDRIYDHYYMKERNTGCPSLLKKVLQVKPKIHVFGHIHEGAGYQETENTLMINASFVTPGYVAEYQPYIVDTDEWKILNP